MHGGVHRPNNAAGGGFIHNALQHPDGGAEGLFHAKRGYPYRREHGRAENTAPDFDDSRGSGRRGGFSVYRG